MTEGVKEKNSCARSKRRVCLWKRWRRIAIVLIFGTSTVAVSQPLVAFTFDGYGLEDSSANVIGNAGYLDDFFEELYLQKNSNDRRISIIHIGDSHIQADYMTRVVRRHFHTYFGNAGRGLIVPYRVAGTNEPANFVSSSHVRWTAKRCVHPTEPLPIGVGGLTITSAEAGADLAIYMNDLWHDYAFNHITLFHQNDAGTFSFQLMDTTGSILAILDPRGAGGSYTEITLPGPTAAIVLKTRRMHDDQKHVTIFGLNFTNGNNGILYHAIGVNGAKYVHYNAAALFAEQTTRLSPQLIILSLGTNEAIEFPQLDRNLPIQIDKLIASLRKANPLAKFLLVTPPPAMRKNHRHNPGVAYVRDKVLQYAVENGLAFYDMFKVLGGDAGAATWRHAGLLRNDGVHFSKEGYEYQGNLFFQALMKGYNDYVPLRHP